MTRKVTKWKKINSKVVYKNPWFEIRKDRVIDPEGKPTFYSVVKMHKKAVGIIVVNNKNKILLIQQFRYPIQKYSWEVPQGGVEKNETLLQAAKRELLEETGYKSRNIKKLGAFYSMLGSSNAHVHFFCSN